jgi:prepilin-type processing-associated H-X9-DG protein
MLYDEIRKDLPWNHPANTAPFQKVIRVYSDPGARPVQDDAGYALSHYAANVRVIGGAVPLARAKITDGLANTIVAGEAAGNYKPWGHPTNWRDPALGINHSPDGFGNLYRGGANMAFADGSVRFLKESIDPAVLKALSTPAGGEPLPEREY